MTASIPIETVGEVDSTSAILKARAEAGAGETALIATTQTAGRGRLGRAWVSPPGNLFLSVLLRPPAPIVPGHWSLLTAVALAECTAAFARAPRLKWPNDLYLGSGKLAGILLDTGGDPAWLVIGIGVNLQHAPTDLGRPVATLARLGRHAPTPLAFATRLLIHLAHWRERLSREGFEPVRSAWLAYGPGPGETVTVSGPGGPTAGRFAGIDGAGALLLDVDGTVRAIHSGEVE